jgi:hypothetical protein
MPIRKLVELDGEYGGWLEVDPVKAKRAALKFKEWLETIDPEKDEFGFLIKDLPIVEGVLDGEIKLPNRIYPHSWEIREGVLPSDYRQISAEFYTVIHGSLDAPPDVIVKNGRYYAWTDWEDDGEQSK